eukprot:PhM_4_TR1327/c5_g1_i1/m.101137
MLQPPVSDPSPGSTEKFLRCAGDGAHSFDIPPGPSQRNSPLDSNEGRRSNLHRDRSHGSRYGTTSPAVRKWWIFPLIPLKQFFPRAVPRRERPPGLLRGWRSERSRCALSQKPDWRPSKLMQRYRQDIPPSDWHPPLLLPPGPGRVPLFGIRERIPRSPAAPRRETGCRTSPPMELFSRMPSAALNVVLPSPNELRASSLVMGSSSPSVRPSQSPAQNLYSSSSSFLQSLMSPKTGISTQLVCRRSPVDVFIEEVPSKCSAPAPKAAYDATKKSALFTNGAGLSHWTSWYESSTSATVCIVLVLDGLSCGNGPFFFKIRLTACRRRIWEMSKEEIIFIERILWHGNCEMIDMQATMTKCWNKQNDQKSIFRK